MSRADAVTTADFGPAMFRVWEQENSRRWSEALREGRRLRERAAVRAAALEVHRRFAGSVEAPPDFDVVKACRP